MTVNHHNSIVTCALYIHILLFQAVVASSFIPGYAGLKDLPVFRGKVKSYDLNRETPLVQLSICLHLKAG